MAFDEQAAYTERPFTDRMVKKRVDPIHPH
jgi:hypothetical protein